MHLLRAVKDPLRDLAYRGTNPRPPASAITINRAMRPFLFALATITFNVNAYPQSHAGQVRSNQRDGQQYVWIPPGNFRMGCSFGDGECLEGERRDVEVTTTPVFW